MNDREKKIADLILTEIERAQLPQERYLAIQRYHLFLESVNLRLDAEPCAPGRK